jgi:hypothetical protein
LPSPTRGRATRRGRNIAATPPTPAGAHIGRPNGIFDLASAGAIYANSEIGRIFLDIIIATHHVAQNVDVNAAEHGRARINLPLTNRSL